MKKAGIALLIFLLTAGAFSAAPLEAEAAKGSDLVLIGGALGSSEGAEEIYEEMVTRAGGEDGKIGVITASSYPYDWDCEEYGDSTDGGCNDPDVSNSKMNANYYINSFEEFGIEAEWIPADLANTDVADDAEWADRISSGEFTGFFLGGGDQSRYIDTFVRGDEWNDSAVLGAIRDLFESGNAMIAGSSAGAAVQASEYMITGGDSYRGITDGSVEGYHSDGSVLGYFKEGGLGFFSYGLVDTHFSERAREGRMIRLAADADVDKVFGVDETTALIVEDANHPSAKMKVVGENGVQIFDLSGASQSVDEEGNWAIEGVNSTYLHHGDRYQPQNGNVVFNPSFSPVRGGDTQIGEHDDIFYERFAYRNMVWELLTSTYDQAAGTSWENDPEYSLVSEKTNRTKTRYGTVFGSERWSYSDVKVSIYPSGQ
ncbi:hypothetical protein CR205_18430 [Alteribacter lacisalsi]|uniref:Cyanophycinase n=1 Tax=Alteribacter lacisalsi TaxID=2045244 RepID=A0A2W0H5R4_9BACI|nr:cyanophycinase [Alteribacter lacisalsi]PYZ95510.1 hypothetical protein CR205_18430 [Alteribacter lacisalsi]